MQDTRIMDLRLVETLCIRHGQMIRPPYYWKTTAGMLIHCKWRLPMVLAAQTMRQKQVKVVLTM